jgi:hypothetical protein
MRGFRGSGQKCGELEFAIKIQYEILWYFRMYEMTRKSLN